MTDFNENSFNVINIREFHPELIRPNSETYDSPKKGFRLVMIGKPNSGKSNLIKALLFWKKHYISVAMVMSGSEDANHDFEKFIHTLFNISTIFVYFFKRFRQRLAQQNWI